MFQIQIVFVVFVSKSKKQFSKPKSLYSHVAGKVQNYENQNVESQKEHQKFEKD